MKFLKERKFFMLLLFLTISINAYILSFSPAVWWDEAVYIGMGKYIYSFGANGFFEAFRPPIMPLILGAIWKIGLNPIVFGRILSVLFFTGVLILTYELGKKFENKFVGFYAALLFAITPFIYTYSKLILSGIPSTFFVLTAYYLYISKKITHKTFILAGTLLGIAFLTRFPQGIAFAVLLCMIFLDNIKNGIKTIATKLSSLTLGFFLVVGPYLIHNYYRYNGEIFYPFFAGAKIITQKLWFHQTGVLFYITDLFAANLFFVLSILGVLFVFSKSSQITTKKSLILISLLVYYTYFSIFLEAKELRFSLVFLPYISIFAAYGATKLMTKISEIVNKNNYIKTMKSSNMKNIFTLFFIILSITTVIIGSSQIYNPQISWISPINSSEPREIFLNFVSDSNLNGTILTTNVIVSAYANNKIIKLEDWDVSEKRYDKYKNISKIVMIDTCSIPCAPNDALCIPLRDAFIERMKNENTELLETETKNVNKNCKYYIYNIN
ncbi:hypothetical protein GQ473_03715 [archaeon]|nr:hypothetical protein [archaeon]